MKNKGRKIYYVVMLVAFISIIAVGSYAYFSLNVTGNLNTTTVKTASLGVTFTDGTEVNVTNVKPGDTATKTFKIKNNSTVSVNYNIKLDEVTNTFVNKSDVTIDLTCDNGGPSTSDYTFPSATSTLVTGSIAASSTVECSMVITYNKTSSIQNDDMGKTLNAKIQITEN